MCFGIAEPSLCYWQSKHFQLQFPATKTPSTTVLTAPFFAEDISVPL